MAVFVFKIAIYFYLSLKIPKQLKIYYFPFSSFTASSFKAFRFIFPEPRSGI
ncbi:Uncharacterised protein [Campylobacter hominis]|nr:Uncharacterised protein [Campylobacter hominis]